MCLSPPKVSIWPFVLSLLAGAALGLAGTIVTPLRTLTHELTFVVASVCVVIVYAAIAFKRRQPAFQEWAGTVRRAARALSLSVVFALGTITITFASNRLVYDCAFDRGIAFFLTTWAPAVLLSAAVSALVRSIGLSRRGAMTAGACLLLATTIHDGLQLYFGPRAYPVDFILGDLAGLSQREVSAPSKIHVLNRAFVLFAAFGMWETARWLIERRSGLARIPRFSSLRPGFLGIAAGIIALVYGSYIGVGIGRGALHAAYTASESTKHFVIHHSESAAVLPQLDAIERNAEWNFAYLCALLGIQPVERLHLYVFDSPADLHTFTGMDDAHAGLGEVFLTRDSALASTITHELTHALHREIRPSPFILLRRGMLEGTAVAFERPYTLVPEAHAMQSAALRQGTLPSAKALLSLAGFRTSSEVSAYESIGSFFGFLIQMYGVEKFAKMQQTLDFSEAYGKNLDELDQQWRAFLDKVPDTPESRLNAGMLFDTSLYPAYDTLVCPKVGRPADARKKATATLMQRKDFAGAREAYLALYRETGDIRLGRSAAAATRDFGDLAGALAITQEMESKPDLKEYARFILLNDRIQCLVFARDWPALYAALDERAVRFPELPLANRMGEACLRNAAIREEYVDAAAEQDPVMRARNWEKLLAAHSDFAPLWYMYFRNGLPAEASPAVHAEALQHVIADSSLAQALAPDLLATATEAIHRADYTTARELSSIVQKTTSNALHRFDAHTLLLRIRFETEGEEVTRETLTS